MKCLNYSHKHPDSRNALTITAGVIASRFVTFVVNLLCNVNYVCDVCEQGQIMCQIEDFRNLKKKISKVRIRLAHERFRTIEFLCIRFMKSNAYFYIIIFELLEFLKNTSQL